MNMHDAMPNGTASEYLGTARETGEILKKAGSAVPAMAVPVIELEKVVAELVARQAETIVETISARIVQRVFAEIKARERVALPTAVSDADPIERLPMPTRVITALHRLGIETIRQLTELRQEDLLRVRSLGEGSVHQVIRILALHGRKLTV
jgi:DNA-directed RNA polymerase alpha subunit